MLFQRHEESTIILFSVITEGQRANFSLRGYPVIIDGNVASSPRHDECCHHCKARLPRFARNDGGRCLRSSPQRL